MNSINIVLIADRRYTDRVDTSLTATDLEMISDDYFYDVFNALVKITPKVTHYNTPEELIQNINIHRNDVVFTIYGGEISRNRMALIPAICESSRIRYAGADTYARILCQDKYLSKLYCEDFGIKTAKGYIVRNIDELKGIYSFNLPLVVKPNMEGSSIGITEKSLINNYEDAIKLSMTLLNTYKQPVLIEEFISGKEVSFYIIGKDGHFDMLAALEIYVESDENYLYSHLYTSNLKHKSDRIRHRIITNEILQNEIGKIRDIYLSLGKIDYMRIDCKLVGNELYLIELTPDAYIGSHSGFVDIANNLNIRYEELFRLIINNALTHCQFPYSN
jgi:D-alanine-D-alanine ligase